MVINTRDFGEVEILEEEILTFTRCIYGFNGLTKFIRLTDPELVGIIWLQSVEDASICFILIDLELYGLDYAPVVSPDSAVLLDFEEGNVPKYFAMATFKENIQESYMNLKSPIVVNESKKIALQEIIEEEYPLRFPLYESEE